MNTSAELQPSIPPHREAERLQNLLASSRPDLERVEVLLRERLDCQEPRLSVVARYLLDLGGKRIRPVLCLLVGRACGYTAPDERMIAIAAGVELIHMATLLHDDIIDKSPLRRHKASAFARFGLEKTLLGGDFLFVRAFGLCGKLGQFVIESTERACVELTEGELAEEVTLADCTLDGALQISRKKTAALFWLAARCAAHITERSAEEVELWSQYGENLGIGFQIVDDILDVCSDEATLGKQPGSDIRERKPSVLNVMWLQSGSQRAKDLLTIPRDSELVLPDAMLREVIADMERCGALRDARALAQAYIKRAQMALREALRRNPKADREAGQHLETIARIAIDRMS